MTDTRSEFDSCPTGRVVHVKGNRFKVNTEVDIPGLEVLEFDESSGLTPPFIVDYGGYLLKPLTQWLERTKDGEKIEPDICIINGLLHTGRTTTMRHVLPQVI